ncbi:MAG: YncE family protein [Thermoplasmata archaeon]
MRPSTAGRILVGRATAAVMCVALIGLTGWLTAEGSILAPSSGGVRYSCCSATDLTGTLGNGSPREVVLAAENRGLVLSGSLGEETIAVGSFPYGIAYDPVNRDLYVADFGSSSISVISTRTNTVISTIPMPYGVDALVADDATGNVFVGDATSTVFEINGTSNKVVANITPVQGDSPTVDVYDPQNGALYAVESFTNRVSIINASQFALVANIGVGEAPIAATYDPANRDIYVVNEGSANITVIDGLTNQVVGQVSRVDPGPGITYDTSNGDLYICSNQGGGGRTNFVSVVNGSADVVVESIPIDSGCGGAIYDPHDGYVYVTDRYSSKGPDVANVTVIDPRVNEVVLTLPVQLGPIGIAYDSASSVVYVADSDTNNVSVLPPIYDVRVREIGLPLGTNWSAEIGGTTLSSTAATINFPQPNGTFNFTVGSVSGFSSSPPSGSIQVAGGPLWLNVTFSKGGGGSGLFGLPGQMGYDVLGGFLAALVATTAVVVVLTWRKRRARPPAGVTSDQVR